MIKILLRLTLERYCQAKEIQNFHYYKQAYELILIEMLQVCACIYSKEIKFI